MATYKVLEDYRLSIGPDTFKQLRAQIRTDYARGVVDRDNYEELLTDLKEEEGLPITEPQFAVPVAESLG